jgi:xylan 1,4-beta-xylosidase
MRQLHSCRIMRRAPLIISTILCVNAISANAIAQSQTPAPSQTSRPVNPSLPTIFVVGDSTANNHANGALGWGDPFVKYFDPAKANVLNRARAGRSSRTFITEGLWSKVLAEMKRGDFVLIQFGHNDGGAINDATRARGSLPGTGEETQEIDNLLTKQHEVVHTYGWYMRKMIADTKTKGAVPIVLSLTVRNIWKDGHVERGSGNFGPWAAEVANSRQVIFIDVTKLIADKYEQLGEEKVKDLFATDHTHTSPAGAELNAAIVVDAIKRLKSPLKSFLLNKSQSSAAGDNTFPVKIRVDASRINGPLRPVWRMFGADEPNFAYMKDGQKLLAELGQLGSQTPVYFRTHNLLTSGNGTPALKWGSTNAYHEDEKGNPVYDWTIVDRIFDTYLKHGLRPYVQIGFMPKDLSIKPEPYQHSWTPVAKYDEIFTGWAYPPKDYAKWGELAYQWAKHCIDRYGRAVVEQWYWEVWNEANIGYWRGTPEEFRKLHDYAIAGVRRALPTARVGGPDTAGSGGKFMTDFLEHCLRGTNYATSAQGTPLDFISFHAKGAPRFADGHVQMGIANQLRAIDSGFQIVASYPELKAKPIVIGESDPDGCAACQGPQLGYRNTTMYSSYTAASVAREYELADKHGVNFDAALTWAFEFEGQPYFAGFRVLATNGIDQPVLNVFRMFSRMSGQRVAAESDGAVPLEAILKDGVRTRPDVAALASLDRNKLCVLIWHYHDDDVSGPDAEVELELNKLPVRNGRATLRHYRIDESHSNAFTEWQRMGSPQQPTAAQYMRLEKAGQLAELEQPRQLTIKSSSVVLRFVLPRHGTSLLVVELQ